MCVGVPRGAGHETRVDADEKEDEIGGDRIAEEVWGVSGFGARGTALAFAGGGRGRDASTSGRAGSGCGWGWGRRG